MQAGRRRHDGQGLRPARPRRRRLPDGHEVGLPARARRRPALPRRQRGRVRAGDLQGHPAHDGQPAAPHRGRDHHVATRSAATTRSSTCAARSCTCTAACCAPIEEAYAAGYLGKDILGSGYDLDITVHAGAGAYICGEETALLDSLEGLRGQPRLKPPFPAVAGPVRAADRREQRRVDRVGARHRRRRRRTGSQSMGTEQSTGHGLFSLSGHVDAARPVRGAARHHAARAARHGRRHPRGPRAEVLDARRLVDADLHRRAPRRPARLRVGRRGRLDARHARAADLRRDHLGGPRGDAVDRVLQARVVRQVHAVPRGHVLAHAGAAAPRGRAGHERGHRPAARPVRQHPRPRVLRARRRRDEPDHVGRPVLPGRSSRRARTRPPTCCSRRSAAALFTYTPRQTRRRSRGCTHDDPVLRADDARWSRPRRSRPPSPRATRSRSPSTASRWPCPRARSSSAPPRSSASRSRGSATTRCSRRPARAGSASSRCGRPAATAALAKMPKPQASCTLEATPGHAGQDAAHVGRGRQGAARRHGAAAHQPPARLPGLRQGRRVPAAEPGDEQRPRHQPVRRRQAHVPQADRASRRRSCSTGSAASCASAARGSPRRSRATRSSTCRSAARSSRSARSTPRCSASRARRPLGAAAEDTSGRPFASYFSGNTIQICPVGALTSAAYRFRSRPFDLVSTPGDRRARLVGLGDPRRPPPRRRAAPARGRRPGGQRGVDHRQGPLRVHVAVRAGPHHDPARARRRDRRAASPRAGPRRSTSRRPACRPRGSPSTRATPRRRRRAARAGALTLEDAYAYAKFARVALGTNDVDCAPARTPPRRRRSSATHVAGRTARR